MKDWFGRTFWDHRTEQLNRIWDTYSSVRNGRWSGSFLIAAHKNVLYFLNTQFSTSNIIKHENEYIF